MGETLIGAFGLVIVFVPFSILKRIVMGETMWSLREV